MRIEIAFVALVFVASCERKAAPATTAPGHGPSDAVASPSPNPGEMAGMPGMAGHGATNAAASKEHEGHKGMPGYAPVTIDEGRRQELGIRTAPVTRQPLRKAIRTVGIVEPDETRTSHVHVKFAGFVEALHVDFTGREVKKGQKLLSIYSQELLAAQQEYLSSRAAVGRIPAGDVGAPARQATEDLVGASRRRLELFDVPPAVLRQIDRTGQAQRTITLVAPRTGTVMTKEAVAGLSVGPETHLYVISDLSRVWVQGDLYERDLANVKVGQKAKLSLEAFPGRTFEGTATFVSPSLDQTTRTAKVRFEFDNPRRELKPGMYAAVELTVDLGEGLVVASDAVIQTGERNVVFVAHPGGHFQPRDVKLGMALDGAYQVLGGVSEGEAIATQGQFLLDSESRLRGSGTAPGHSGH